MTTASDVVAPPERMYSVGAVVWASFFASALGGAFIMAKNFDRLGRSDQARRILWVGAAVTAVAFVVTFAIPERIKIPNAVFYLPPILFMWSLAKQQQGAAIADHRASGGEMYSNWRAVGIGAIGTVVLVLVILVVAVIQSLVTGGAASTAG